MDEKPEIIALNKSDTMTDEDAADRIAALKAHTGRHDIFLISAVAGRDVRPVLFALKNAIQTARAEPDEINDPFDLGNLGDRGDDNEDGDDNA